MENKEKIKEILSQIHIELQTVLDLAKDNLLKGEREHDVIVRTKNSLNEIKSSFGEIEQLKIERAIPMWINEPKSGVFLQEDGVKRKIEPLLRITSELIKIIGSQIPQKDIFISENSPFEGRKILRSIINQAKNDILFIDCYLKPEILEIIQLNLADNPNISIRFLTQKNNNKFFNTFLTDLVSFSKQYLNTKVEFRYYDNLTSHDRYIFIDNNLIYHFGHSFAELGNRASSVNKVEGEAYNINKNNIITLWSNGNK